MPAASFAGDGPDFAPEAWFARHTLSQGVFEDADGAPLSRFTTDSVGTRDADGTLVLRQTVHLGDGTKVERTWRLRRLDSHRYEATADPVVGTARGEAYGRLFHWQYTYRLPPGDWLHTVAFEHWMYLDDDGRTVLNRFVVRKLGITVAHASETFRPAEE